LLYERVTLVLVSNNVMVEGSTQLEEAKEPILDAIDSDHQMLLKKLATTTIESITIATSNPAELAF
jgi:hypothetical protein